jgi:hypothetical protein
MHGIRGGETKARFRPGTGFLRFRCVTRHCHRCGWDWTFREQPGRSETCPQCRADLRVCLNCHQHARNYANQCRDSRAEPVSDKDVANFCEYFDFARRTWAGAKSNSREDEARAKLKDLLGGL